MNAHHRVTATTEVSQRKTIRAFSGQLTQCANFYSWSPPDVKTSGSKKPNLLKQVAGSQRSFRVHFSGLVCSAAGHFSVWRKTSWDAFLRVSASLCLCVELCFS